MKKVLTKEELTTIYYSNTNDDACKILGVSKATFLSYLKKAGIKMKGKGYGQKIEIQ